MHLILTRDMQLPDCTLGLLNVNGTVYCTIEKPWANNAEGKSCVPAGTYELMRHDSQKHPKTWALENKALHVTHFPDPAHPDWRSACLLHPANWASELEGCIAPGMSRQMVAGVWMVEQSKSAMDAIKDAVPWIDGHTLEIR